MTKKILSLYPNCSLGGMTTVFRNRALVEPNDEFYFFFQNDKSGTTAYNDLANGTIRIVPKGRYQSFVEYATSILDFDEIRVTSLPDIMPKIGRTTAKIVYEFHSSDENVIEHEIKILDLSLIDEILTPSEFLAEAVRARLKTRYRDMVRVLPNLVDESVFNQFHPWTDMEPLADKIPVVWIGRFDKGKNPRDFLRMMSLLPEQYHGIMILSFEDQPERMADLLGEGAGLGVLHRIHLLLNLKQRQIAEIYRLAASSGGVFCSTSLGESFGYGVAEALASGLKTVAYEVGALSEFTSEDPPYELVPVGDIRRLTQTVYSLTNS